MLFIKAFTSYFHIYRPPTPPAVAYIIGLRQRRNMMGDGGRWGEATAEGRLCNRSPRLACLPGVGC